MAAQSQRRTAQEIFDAVVQSARDELDRSSRALAFSGFIGGVNMGLTGLSVAIIRGSLGEAAWASMAANLLYPLGFIAVIIGRAQLFTENTLYPVVLVLDERRHLANTARLWAVVFASNVLGAAAFALLMTRTHALHGPYVEQLVKLGVEASGGSFGSIFWSGVVGGWLIALVAWLVTAGHWTIGQVVVIWMLTFVVGAGHFSHCIASSGEILAAVFYGELPWTRYLAWLLPATLGNTCGGVFLVSVLNYGQVRSGEEGEEKP